jgi:tripartite-type tricarboxylate transporter receptor subunit TctC
MKKNLSMKLVWLTLALAFTLTLASAASAQPGTFVKGVLQPLADGFPNRPIVLMVVDDVGSSESLLGTALLDKAKPMSPVPILLEHRADFSNYGTWEAVRWIMDQGKLGSDGYITYFWSPSGSVSDLLVMDVKTEVGVDLDDINVITSLETHPYFMIQRSNAPWGATLQDMVAYAKKNPNTLRAASAGPGGAMFSALKWYQKKLDYTAKDVIIGSKLAQAIAVGAGECDTTIMTADVVLPHFQNGKVKVLMVSGSNRPDPPFESVPTSASFGMKGDPYASIRAIACLKSVPESHRVWLEKLFNAAASDKEYLANRKKTSPGVDTTILDREATLKIAKNFYDFTLPIFKETGLYWADKKK